jgi:hypothetical protein
MMCIINNHHTSNIEENPMVLKDTKAAKISKIRFKLIVLQLIF